jgi:FkbM family methyltransferase
MRDNEFEYESLLKIRDEVVDGVGPWVWIAQDTGAWDGPKHDWESSHKEGIKDLVTDWSACIQAGGNQGMYPRVLANMFQHVYTFEPDPLNFHCLAANCQLDNIYKVNAALGAESGLVKVNRGNLNNAGTHTVSTNGECHVPMFTIDSLKLPSCGLFQLDLEGYEIHALKGAIETIQRCKPVIQCENGNNAILEFLQQFGYQAVAQSKADTFYKVV